MVSWSHRIITGIAIACLIIALATLGGYRLAGSTGSMQGHVRLAFDTAQTWVSSSTGSNTNAASPNYCSRTTPCKDLFTAYGVTAPGGEIDTIDACYCQAVSIGRAMTIDGLGGGKGSVTSVYVAAGQNDVVIL